MDLSSHYLLEVEPLGTPYRIIWTRDEGCVDRPLITPKKRRSKHVSAMKLPDADAFTDYFRARCASLPPLLLPQAPSLPRSTYQMSHSEWLAILDDLASSLYQVIPHPPPRIGIRQLRKCIPPFHQS
jgi:hypothetical protein